MIGAVIPLYVVKLLRFKVEMLQNVAVLFVLAARNYVGIIVGWSPRLLNINGNDSLQMGHSSLAIGPGRDLLTILQVFTVYQCATSNIIRPMSYQDETLICIWHRFSLKSRPYTETASIDFALIFSSPFGLGDPSWGCLCIMNLCPVKSMKEIASAPNASGLISMILHPISGQGEARRVKKRGHPSLHSCFKCT